MKSTDEVLMLDEIFTAKHLILRYAPPIPSGSIGALVRYRSHRLFRQPPPPYPFPPQAEVGLRSPQGEGLKEQHVYFFML
jgi:hypothetical protein